MFARAPSLTMPRGFRDIDSNPAEDPHEESVWTTINAEFLKETHPKNVDRGPMALMVQSAIVLNSVMIGLEMDLKSPESPETIWVVMENIFTAVFVFEMVVTLRAKRMRYFQSVWNTIDFIIVMMSAVDVWLLRHVMRSTPTNVSLSVFRLFRTVKVLRALRIFRVMKKFNQLWMLWNGIAESLSAINWIVLLIIMFLYMFSLAFRFFIDCDVPGEFQSECVDRWANIGLTMFTLLQVMTLEGWPDIALPLAVSKPELFVLLLIFLFFATFVLMSVMVGVIVENMLTSQKENEVLQNMRLVKRRRNELESLRNVFNQVDTDKNGAIDRDEFLAFVTDAQGRDVLRAMDVPTDDPEMLFDLLDSRECGFLERSEFVGGIIAVSGAPTAMDQKALLILTQGISRRVMLLEKSIGSSSRRTSSTEDPFNCQSTNVIVSTANDSRSSYSTIECAPQDNHSGQDVQSSSSSSVKSTWDVDTDALPCMNVDEHTKLMNSLLSQLRKVELLARTMDFDICYHYKKFDAGIEAEVQRIGVDEFQDGARIRDDPVAPQCPKSPSAHSVRSQTDPFPAHLAERCAMTAQRRFTSISGDKQWC